ncbi:MAG TPA: cyclase family protein, partial [Pyrinomonadaceae bacterium]|nr:cyclase family protein [Pyrinomonadaceae bacterium]
VTYSGDAISMYTHTGTHIDTLNHFGLDGKIWNGFDAHEHVGSRAWQKAGAEKYPPIIARGVLIDIAKVKGVEMLPDSYVITPEDLKNALALQKTELLPGDAVLFRTGRMKLWADQKYMQNSPGLGLEAAKWLVEEKKAMLLGGDTLSFEKLPSSQSDNWIPVHTYLLAERGVSIIEVLQLEDLAKDNVYEFAFISAPLKLRGATGSPIRPIAIPVHKKQ